MSRAPSYMSEDRKSRQTSSSHISKDRRSRSKPPSYTSEKRSKYGAPSYVSEDEYWEPAGAGGGRYPKGPPPSYTSEPPPSYAPPSLNQYPLASPIQMPPPTPHQYPPVVAGGYGQHNKQHHQPVMIQPQQFPSVGFVQPQNVTIITAGMQPRPPSYLWAAIATCLCCNWCLGE